MASRFYPTHEESCVKAAFDELRWRQAHPNACTKCGGHGFWQSGWSYSNPPDGGPCSCVERLECPVCNGPLIQFEVSRNLNDPITTNIKSLLGDYQICIACGWNDFITIHNLNLAYEFDWICPIWECYCGQEEEEERMMALANDIPMREGSELGSVE